MLKSCEDYNPIMDFQEGKVTAWFFSPRYCAFCSDPNQRLLYDEELLIHAAADLSRCRHVLYCIYYLAFSTVLYCTNPLT